MTKELETSILTTDRLAVTVAPALGGRITEITDLENGRQWLWRNSRVPLGPVPDGSHYDDVWQGGFEELFPNDAPTDLGGLDLPDHGELWSSRWDIVEEHEDGITLTIDGPVTGVNVTKSLEVENGKLSIRYRLSNDGGRPLPHMFKLHPAMAVNEHCTLDLPGGIVEKVEDGFGNLLADGTGEAEWPTVGDLDRCRPQSSETNEFVYVSSLAEGWCGVTDAAAGSWIRFDYPLEVFPFTWLFITYGGWNDHNVVVLEPCTNYPKDLHLAVANGTSAELISGVPIEFEVIVTVGSI